MLKEGNDEEDSEEEGEGGSNPQDDVKEAWFNIFFKNLISLLVLNFFCQLFIFTFSRFSL